MMTEVRCSKCNKLLCKAAPGSVIEAKCPRCGNTNPADFRGIPDTEQIADIKRFNEDLKRWFWGAYPNRISDVAQSVGGLVNLTGLNLREIRTASEGQYLPSIPIQWSNGSAFDWCQWLIRERMPKDTEVPYFVRLWPYVYEETVPPEDGGDGDEKRIYVRMRVYVIDGGCR